MTKEEKTGLTIIGIGSSAGGLEAIRELVATLPANLPVTYVVVQHMSPHHKSLMTELVARQTELRVADVEDGLKPEGNVIYITPPKTDVILEDGRLRLVSPSEAAAAPKPSVDRFLLSLADDHGEKSVAMILSGTGTDGAYGVQAIREAGGITIAQDADSAKYDGMPQAAVGTGCVDLVLRPLEIGTHLQKILKSPRDFLDFRREALNDTPLTDLLQVLLARTRVDFRDYKQSTVTRRIERRMIALGIDNQEEYTQFLRTNPDAVDALFKDLLISVTRFFRDKNEFEKLKAQLPQLIKDVEDGPVRVWIAGCATGEEAYSIAMLLAEAIGDPDTPLKQRVQIFATDIDKNALTVARAGIYGAAALNDIPEDLASKYLIKHGDGIRVTDTLRSAILFSDHNVCQDPPFQRVHLLCCRNLLIYFGAALQRKVMSRFHYSMAPDGLLFLGTAESVAGSDELFNAMGSDSRIYRKRTLSKGDRPYTMPNVATFNTRPDRKKQPDHTPSTDRQFFEALMLALGENSILVAEDGRILRINGTINAYVDMSANTKLNMHLDLLRSPLREEARSLLTISLKNGARRTGVRHEIEGTDEKNLQLDVFPIIAPKINERTALIVFSEVESASAARARSTKDQPVSDAVGERIEDLEHELSVTREALQQTIEELETSNEELQSLNEEMQSTNEELQATNEELETSNEELQSTNEELITVNEELQITATELSGRTGELTSVLQSTPLAIVVTDSALQITQITPAATELFGLSQPISNPHISQINLPEGFPALAPICSDALRLGETTEHEFNIEGSQVLMSCTPYFDVHGKIRGLTLVITRFPGMAREMEVMLDTTSFYMLSRTPDGEILRISRASAEAFGLTRDEAIGQNFFDLLPKDLVETARKTDQMLLSEDMPVVQETIHLPHKGKGRDVWLSLERKAMRYDAHSPASIFAMGIDVTDDLEAFDQTQSLLDKFRHVQDIAGHGYWEITPGTNDIYWSTKVFELHGVDPDEGEPPLNDAIAFYHKDDVEQVQAAVRQALEPGGEFSFQARLIQKNGTEIKVESRGYGIPDATGEISKVVGTFRLIED